MTKTKSKPKSKKRVPLKMVPKPIQETILSALVFENAIGLAQVQMIKDNPDLEQDVGIFSAGLALAIAALTSPKSKLFAKMINDVSPSALADYNTVKGLLSDHYQIVDKRLMH